MFHDEPLSSRKEAMVAGEDLSEMSIDQLTERLEVLRLEMGRTEAAIKQKKAGLSAAEAFFKTPGGN